MAPSIQGGYEYVLFLLLQVPKGDDHLQISGFLEIQIVMVCLQRNRQVQELVYQGGSGYLVLCAYFFCSLIVHFLMFIGQFPSLLRTCST